MNINQPAIEQARQALQSDSYANFSRQLPYLRQWLESLPILPVETLVQQKRSVERATQGRLDEIMTLLETKWRAYHPPNSHEGAVSAAFGEAPDLLVVTFHAYVWGMTSEQGGLVLARIGNDAYLLWTTF